MDISVKVIPHSEQRYETVGDWWFDEDGTLQIRVSRMADDRYNCLVAIHEAIEAILCRNHGITAEAVDAFDKYFEAKRDRGEVGADEEAGEDEDAPYRWEHFFATKIEYLFAAELGVAWQDYDAAVHALKQ